MNPKDLLQTLYDLDAKKNQVQMELIFDIDSNQVVKNITLKWH